MTDLSREQIEYWRNRLTPDAIKQNASLAIHDICDMALAKKDAEQRAQRAEAENARLRDEAERYRLRLESLDPDRIAQREAGIKVVRDEIHKKGKTLSGKITKEDTTRWVYHLDKALAMSPPEGEPCDVCGGEGRRALPNANNTMVHYPFCTACKGTGKVPHTPEQTKRPQHETAADEIVGIAYRLASRSGDEDALARIVELSGAVAPDVQDTPEQGESYPLDSEGRCLKCGGTGRIGVDSTREPCPACTSTAPQQTHGDALAAKLDRISKATPGNIDAAPESVAVYREWWQFIQDTAAEARQALTASGVPYVPEEVRRIAKLADTALIPETVPHTLEPLVWRVREIKRGADKALASAPAVCEWTCQGLDAYGHEQFRGQCGAEWWCIEGYAPELIRDEHPYCHGCGRRIQIAAAPTDGRE